MTMIMLSRNFTSLTASIFNKLTIVTRFNHRSIDLDQLNHCIKRKARSIYFRNRKQTQPLATFTLSNIRSFFTFNLNSRMPKAKVQNRNGKKVTQQDKSTNDNDVDGPIRMNTNSSITIHVLAKPGAKQNNITGISPDGIEVQISAPPVDGEANAELLKYIASILRIRKSGINLDKGSRSRSKILLLDASMGLSVEEVETRISSHIS